MGDLNATVATVGTIEVLLRVFAVFFTGFASAYIGWQVIRHKIRPRLIWIYVGAVATATFIWRFIVLAMLFLPGLRENMIDWITPITATMYCLGALSLFILAFCSSRRRSGDE